MLALLALGPATAAPTAQADPAPRVSDDPIGSTLMLWFDGKTNEAIAPWTDAVARDPRDAGAHLRLAHLLIAAGDLPRAQFHAEQAATLQPTNALAHAAWGGVLLRRGFLDDAASRLAHAADLDPHDAPIRNEWALALARQGNWSEAETQLARAADLDEHQALTRLYWAALLVAQGTNRHDDARTQYERARALGLPPHAQMEAILNPSPPRSDATTGSTIVWPASAWPSNQTGPSPQPAPTGQ